MTGIFISLEGPDGSGKSTAAKKILPQLQQLSTQEVVLTREPGGSAIAEQLRDIILDVHNSAMDARTEALLYAAQRRQHIVDVILPALQANKIVLSDRYIDSSVAYQGAGRQLGMQEIWQLNLFATQKLLPQLTLYFDIPPAVGLKRIQQKRAQAADRLEKEQLDFHQRVTAAYQQLIKQDADRIVKIDALQTPDQVVADCLAIISQRFNLGD
ncbi:MAG: dTMP kinase [Bombilactobacillus mellis]|uniref:dTMP kinase n=1 Tax=Bombilactobacillus mellis TaxID=1218508 RepID=UPI00224748D0|nr:dTMP kinase [Bombilactobacillus mellis]MCT6840798.1 dTMP kinase [Bombilactobacillus mellis]MCT6857132.1 dTMP kinase [Bombilactobacillus mellis]MCT6872705.1 dTMP kinase [Bombilactobacillus mellis]MCX0279783.1 dTMP kinase [Bombilactobacillus mellis]